MKIHRFARGRARRTPGTMNKTEARYAAHLDLCCNAGAVAWHRYEAVTFKLAPDTRYTPDFLVMLPDGSLEAHEVKGFWEDDALVKIKCAAEMFPIKFIAVTERAKKHGGGWDVREFGTA